MEQVKVSGAKPGGGTGEETSEQRSRPGLHAGSWLLALCIGAIFLLPHLVRIADLGSYAAYTPFTALSPSSMPWDETFLYAAEANYSLTRHGQPAYDDSWEHRHDVYPYSIVPAYIEAGIALVAGGMKNAHLLMSFVFPAIASLLLMALFRRTGADTLLAALLAWTVLVIGFSPQTLWLDDLDFFHHAQGASAVDALEAARTPNPNVTFPLLLLALLCLSHAIRRGAVPRASLRWAAAAGAIGGLLYFSYVYYAIPWSIAIGLCSLIALLRPQWMSRSVWVGLAVTVAMAIPFLIWKHVSDAEGSYLPRSVRLGLDIGHTLNPQSLRISAEWALEAVVCAAVWIWLRRRRQAKEPWSLNWDYADAWMSLLLAIMVGALVGINMQVITGFNIQANHHFPHMVLQPVGLMMIGVLVALAWSTVRPYRLAPYRLVLSAALLLVGVASVLAQVEAARDSAEAHRMTPARQRLTDWLNRNSETGSVVATDDLELSSVLPVLTHNSVLFSDGSRSGASDEELMERFLLASRLSGTPAAVVSEELSNPDNKIVPLMSYTRYLFEINFRYEHYGDDHFVAPERLPPLLREFAEMDLAGELRRFRVDYLWTEPGRQPATVPGWTLTPVLDTADGRLWRLSHR